MDMKNWRQLADRGPDLVLCLDFPGGRAAAGFAELVAGLPVDACFLHIGQAGGAPLAECVADWVAQITATGRPVRAVLGFCAGTTLATRVADAIAAIAPPPMVVLFDAVATTCDSLVGGFIAALESSADHLAPGELAAAQDLADQLVATDPDDLPRIAAALNDRYTLLMTGVAERLSLPEFYRQELTNGFTAYLDYRLLTGEGGFDMRSTTPLLLSSADYDAPPIVAGARTVILDIGHVDLLRDPEVHKLVTALLTGEQPW
jgi:hypothetical protein